MGLDTDIIDDIYKTVEFPVTTDPFTLKRLNRLFIQWGEISKDLCLTVRSYGDVRIMDTEARKALGENVVAYIENMHERYPEYTVHALASMLEYVESMINRLKGHEEELENLVSVIPVNGCHIVNHHLQVPEPFNLSVSLEKEEVVCSEKRELFCTVEKVGNNYLVRLSRIWLTRDKEIVYPGLKGLPDGQVEILKDLFIGLGEAVKDSECIYPYHTKETDGSVGIYLASTKLLERSKLGEYRQRIDQYCEDFTGKCKEIKQLRSEVVKPTKSNGPVKGAVTMIGSSKESKPAEMFSLQVRVDWLNR